MRPRTFVGIAATLVLVAGTFGAAALTYRQEDRQAEAERQLAVREVAGSLQAELGQMLATVESAGIVMRTDDGNERVDFAGLAELALGRDGLSSLSWAPYLREGDRRLFELQYGERSGAPVSRPNPTESARRKRGRSCRSRGSIRRACRTIVGLDTSKKFSSARPLRNAIDRWIHHRFTARPRVFDARGVQAVIYHPVYRDGEPVATPAQRRRAMVGVVGASVRADQLHSVVSARGVDLRITDGQSVLSGPPGLRPDGRYVTETIQVGPREWVVMARVPSPTRRRRSSLRWWASY